MTNMKKPEMKLVISKDQIDKRVKKLAEEISEAYSDREVILIGVLNGVFLFFADLAKHLSIPAKIDFIRLASYGADTKSCGQIMMTKDVENDLSGKNVVIVEDIVDSGLTLDWLKRHLKVKGATTIETCVLIDKNERRELDIALEYVGFKVEEGFLVGYGLDYDGDYRCLPEIFHLVTT